MKRYEYSDDFNHDKYKAQEWKREHNAGGFRCSHCKQFVIINDIMGTVNRNHCNWCLWSKHVDEAKGDRLATCHGGMEPIGLTFKHEGQGKIGEIMLIHLCSVCDKVSINRIARDDPEQYVLDIFHRSLDLKDEIKQSLYKAGIDLLERNDTEEVNIQLFGNT
ncbi:MAG TPA: RNHCP domain-containing protein [Candidatus Saccharimonadales bacterium]|jgi:hypothetical protein|nr:RNHCP domain-containing protein [Candidatus Saccharimonadales bacterium]